MHYPNYLQINQPYRFELELVSNHPNLDFTGYCTRWQSAQTDTASLD